MTTLLTHADPVQPTLATDSIEPVDVPGLPRYHEVVAAIFCDPTRLDVVAAYALEAWNEAAAAGIASLAGIRKTHQRAYEAAARVLNEAWERELADLADAFELREESGIPSDSYFVPTEPEPALGLPAGPRLGQYNVRRGPSGLMAEDFEAAEVRGWTGGHEA